MRKPLIATLLMRAPLLAFKALRLVAPRRRWRYPARMRRRVLASGLFDEESYLLAYPDVGAAPFAPVDHFLAYGWAEGRDPNPVFSVSWYLSNNPDVRRAGLNPLVHYIDSGERGGRQPSPIFSPRYYAERYPDIRRAGVSPLRHYLSHGRSEGRAPLPAADAAVLGEPVDLAALVALKPLEEAHGGDVALLVSHCHDGRLRPHVEPYARGLRRSGRKVALVVMADAPFVSDAATLEAFDAVYVRENRGFDFAAWAHMLRIAPWLYTCRTLVLTNDSVLPPRTEARLASCLEAMEARSEAVLGLTDSYEGEWHIQSYFLLLKPAALCSVALHRFVLGIRGLKTKAEVIEASELAFASTMRAAGVACGVLFPAHAETNGAIARWRELLLAGHPLVKLSALQQRDASLPLGDWRPALAAAGFDDALASTLLTPTAGARPGSLAGMGGLLASPSRRTFTPPLKLDYLGPWNYDNGLGVASRSLVQALWRTPYRINLRPVRKPFHTHSRAAPMVDVVDFDEPADVALIHLNPDAMVLTDAVQRRRIANASLRIGVWVWEMAAMPEVWRDALNEMDAIWAPSSFCAEAFRAAAPHKPVHVVPQVVDVAASPPTPIRPRLQSVFGIAEDRRLIVYAFDGASYLVRKNPFALVRAFAASGLAAEGWTLVLKTKNLLDRPQEGRELSEFAGRTAAVVLIDTPMSGADLRALIGAAEIYASPHCAEGFGLTVAEAMGMGLSVVATDYSGTRDFLDADCGYPVAYALHELARDHGHYRRGGVWARIDEAALAATLQRAAADLDRGAGPGERARRRIADALSPAQVAARIQASVDDLVSRRRR